MSVNPSEDPILRARAIATRQTPRTSPQRRVLTGAVASHIDQADKAQEQQEREYVRAQINTHNDQVEAQYRNEGRPFYSDSSGIIRPSQSDDQWQAELQQKQADEAAKKVADAQKEQLKHAKAQGIRTEVDPATAIERPVTRDDGSPVFNPSVLGSPQIQQLEDGRRTATAQIRDAEGNVHTQDVRNIRWDADTKTHRFKSGEKELAIPGDSPLSKIDQKTGDITVLSEDPQSRQLMPQIIGKDERTVRSVEFDRRIHDATNRSTLLQQEHDLFKQQSEPVFKARDEAKSKLGDFRKEIYRMIEGVPHVAATRSGVTTFEPVSDPVQSDAARDWLTRRSAAQTALELAQAPAADAEQLAHQQQIELRSLAVQKVRLTQAKEKHLTEFDQAASKGLSARAPDWKSYDASPIAKSAAITQLESTDPGTVQELKAAEQAITNATLEVLTSRLQGIDDPQKAEFGQKAIAEALLPFTDDEGRIDENSFGRALTAGLSFVGSLGGAQGNQLSAKLQDLSEQLVATNQAQQIFTGIRGQDIDLASPEGRDAAIRKTLPVDHPASFSLNARPNSNGQPFIDLRDERTGEDVASYMPELGVLSLSWQGKANMGTLQAPQIADNGLPLYFGPVQNRLSDAEKTGLMAEGVRIRSQQGTIADIENAGLGMTDIRAMLNDGRLSYQEARTFQRELHGLEDSDLPTLATEQGLQGWMSKNEAQRRMWDASGNDSDVKAQLINEYWDDVNRTAKYSDLAYNGKALREARAKMVEKLAGKSALRQVGDFVNELGKQSFGSLAAVVYRGGKELGHLMGGGKALEAFGNLTGIEAIQKFSASEHERRDLSLEQTAEWLKNVDNFYRREVLTKWDSQPKVRQALFDVAQKVEDAGVDSLTDADIAPLRDAALALYHDDKLSPEQMVERGISAESFDPRKDPAIRAQLQNFAETGNLNHFQQALRLLALDPKARAIEARVQ